MNLTRRKFVKSALSGLFVPAFPAIVRAQKFLDARDLSYFASGAAPVKEMVTSVTGLGSVRNDLTLMLGINFSPNAAITVTHLGRLMQTGNSGSHLLLLYSNSITTSGCAAGTCSSPCLGNVSVSMSGGTVGQFVYGQLGTPVTLVANQGYSLFAYETAGGDNWSNHATITLTTDFNSGIGDNGQSQLVCASGSFSIGSGTCGTCNGPLSIKYHL